MITDAERKLIGQHWKDGYFDNHRQHIPQTLIDKLLKKKIISKVELSDRTRYLINRNQYISWDEDNPKGNQTLDKFFKEIKMAVSA